MKHLDTLIFIPTYNEIENVGKFYAELRKQKIAADILFLDDNSPDGTGKLIDEITQKDPGVHAIHRAGKLGIGSAHQAGIAWAYERNYKTLVTMDCDFTHLPEDIPRFLEWADRFDVVIGSRYMDKNSIADWNMLRKFLTKLGHFLTTTLLAMPYDASGAFRLYQLDRIAGGVFGLVRSKSYSFFFETLHILSLNRFTIKEIPIRLPKRTYGSSKMQVSDALNSFNLLVTTWWMTVTRRSDFIYQGAVAPRQNTDHLEDERNWDDYWGKKSKKSKWIYDVIASFYRNVIIRPTLNSFIKEEFAAGASILHAGCGGGEVDTWITRHARVTALDISKLALGRYQATHHGHCQVLHGSIFDIPAPEASFDGIYNLGVMEHFSEEDILTILKEFRRVLKPGGKLVLFWPPKQGLTVKFLKVVHYILNDVMKKQIKLHPDEITHLQSKNHASSLLEKAGFSLQQYSFGLRDAFTYAILVGAKAQDRPSVENLSFAAQSTKESLR